MSSIGLRERRKAETRATISNVATLAFFERGFDQVTIAEIAELAGVSKMTVTNYFPLKEDLVFDLAPRVVSSLADAVAQRAPGESLAACLHRDYLDRLRAGDPSLGTQGVEFMQMVAASPALRGRGMELSEQREAALAEAIGGQPEHAGDPVGAAMAAKVLAGVTQVLIRQARQRLLDGMDETEIVHDVAGLAGRLFAAAEVACDALQPTPA